MLPGHLPRPAPVQLRVRRPGAAEYSSSDDDVAASCRATRIASVFGWLTSLSPSARNPSRTVDTRRDASGLSSHTSAESSAYVSAEMATVPPSSVTPVLSSSASSSSGPRAGGTPLHFKEFL